MKAVLIERFGDNDRVRLAEVPRPTPTGSDLLVEVKAASINPVDVKLRSGKLKPLIPYRLPLVLGNDLSGVVVEVGPDVKQFTVGDHIFARLDKDRIGALAYGHSKDATTFGTWSYRSPFLVPNVSRSNSAIRSLAVSSISRLLWQSMLARYFAAWAASR